MSFFIGERSIPWKLYSLRIWVRWNQRQWFLVENNGHIWASVPLCPWAISIWNGNFKVTWVWEELNLFERRKISAALRCLLKKKKQKTTNSNFGIIKKILTMRALFVPKAGLPRSTVCSWMGLSWLGPWEVPPACKQNREVIQQFLQENFCCLFSWGQEWFMGTE